MTIQEELIKYYSQNSKHSNYQVLPKSLRKIIGEDDVQTRTRFEAERLEYITRKIDFSQQTVLDIGGNTGFFTFELLDFGTKSIKHYEGNKTHSDFVSIAAQALNVTDKVTTTNEYFSFDGSNTEFYDTILLFNVLHHIGDDYGDQKLSIENAKLEIIKQLNSLATNCSTMVFQLGFNWQGDPAKPLFENGTKSEQIEFIKSGIKDNWEVVCVGIAEKADGLISYNDLNDSSLERDDSLGEFLNRPIFILKSSRGSK